MRRIPIMLGAILSMVLFLTIACGAPSVTANPLDDLQDSLGPYRDAIRVFTLAKADWDAAQTGDVAADQAFLAACDAMRQADLDLRQALSAIDAYPDLNAAMTTATQRMDDYLTLRVEMVHSASRADSPAAQEAYEAWTQSWDTATQALVEVVTNEED